MTTPRSDDNNSGGPNEDGLRPFYAVAGLTDVVARTVRERVRSGRVIAAERWTQLSEQARTRRPDLPRIDLSRINLTDLEHSTRAAYASLAVRGRHAVDEARDRARDFAREFGDQYGGRLRGTIAAPFGRATDLARPMAEKLFKHERAEEQPGDEASAEPTDTPPTGGSTTVGMPTAGTPTAEAPTADAPLAGTPTQETPIAGMPTAGTPTAEGPTADAPIGEAPTAEDADDNRPAES